MPNLDLTAIILTHNEEPNIARTLGQLNWVPEIVVLDSNSTDNTVEIALSFSNVRVVQRTFDTHTKQWNFALQETGIESEWILALDADYYLRASVAAEIQERLQDAKVDAYWLHFDYAIRGEVIRSGIYPPVQVLYRRMKALYRYDGHTQRISVQGESDHLENRAIHDDRKPFRRWISSQVNYAELEAEKLLAQDIDERNKRDKIRLSSKLTPILVFIYCILGRSGWRDGYLGWLYGFQRLIAEVLLQYFLIEKKH